MNAEATSTDEVESANSLSFSKAIETMNILYIHENKEQKQTLYTFDEFREVKKRNQLYTL